MWLLCAVMSEGDEIYTVAEVARRLKVSPETLRRRIAAGELVSVAVSSGARKHHRITAGQLKAWLGAGAYAALFAGDAHDH